MTSEQIYGRLLDFTEELADDGATPQDVAQTMATFLCELSYDCAPCPQLATHLILSAITGRIEREHEEVTT